METHMNSFTPEEDFPQIVDKTEAIRLTRFGSDLNISIHTAFRRRPRISQRKDIVSERRQEYAWVFSDVSCCVKGCYVTPLPGDRLRDSANTVWTILTVTHLSKVGCWECRALDTRLLHGLDTWVDFYAAAWEPDALGVPTPRYELKFAGLNAKIIPLKTVADEKFPFGKAEIYFEEPINPSLEDCFVTPDQRRFCVLEFHPDISPGNISRCVTREMKP